VVPRTWRTYPTISLALTSKNIYAHAIQVYPIQLISMITHITNMGNCFIFKQHNLSKECYTVFFGTIRKMKPINWHHVILVTFLLFSAAWGIAAVFLWSHVSFSGDGESTKFRNWVNAWLCGILIANLCGMVVWRKLRIVLILLIIFSLPILIHFTTPTF
jgi:hypothetical protein